jgi:leucyl aminopeptidase
MLNCFSSEKKSAIAVLAFTAEIFSTWLNTQSEKIKAWVKANNFSAKAETFCLIPNDHGQLAQVLFGVKEMKDFWSFGLLSTALPTGSYFIENITDKEQLTQIAIAWAAGAYQFVRYKTSNKSTAHLVIAEQCDKNYVEQVAEAIYYVRTLINTPTEDMGPAHLAEAAHALAEKFHAEFKQIIGDGLLKNNYPTIHAVGRASTRDPLLIDLRWGDEHAPKVTLVGKGVCFDSGGLDLKEAAGMLLMKKDMGGAAHVLGLARLIMALKLPVRLRVLIPAVENVIAGNAYKPCDVIKTRKGLTVEIGNTDAEGRLILCDALAEAVTEQPEVLIDFATLTGAARVALGTEISALFSNNDQFAQQLIQHGEQQQDPIWQLPLHASYRKLLDSKIADINNTSSAPYGGAITAALFLKEFVPDNITWAHFDINAWNNNTRPGRPEGAEMMAVRAVFSYLKERFKP